MQYRIYKQLNMLLFLMLAIPIVFTIIVVINLSYFQEYMITIFIVVFLYNIICFFLFKMLEKNWDSAIIQKMAIDNQVVIANIKSAKIAFPFRDSSRKLYNMWEITVDYIDHDMSTHEFVFFEKLNPNQTELPLGTVFMTNDDKKPGRKFIVPNVVISHIESMMPIVENYEKQKKASIKYLNVYYKDGLVIETYKQSINKQKQTS